MKYECENCGKEFKRNEHLKTHMKKKNPCTNPKKTYDCEKCNHSFSTKSNLNKHRKMVVCDKEPDEEVKDDGQKILKTIKIINNEKTIMQQRINELENMIVDKDTEINKLKIKVDKMAELVCSSYEYVEEIKRNRLCLP